jgi:hypothetical protein
MSPTLEVYFQSLLDFDAHVSLTIICDDALSSACPPPSPGTKSACCASQKPRRARSAEEKRRNIEPLSAQQASRLRFSSSKQKTPTHVVTPPKNRWESFAAIGNSKSNCSPPSPSERLNPFYEDSTENMPREPVAADFAPRLSVRKAFLDLALDLETCSL